MLYCNHGSQQKTAWQKKSGVIGGMIMPFENLSVEERIIIRMRFGIGLDRRYTFDEIGRLLSLTSQMAGMIEKAALRKLRHPAMDEQLGDR